MQTETTLRDLERDARERMFEMLRHVETVDGLRFLDVAQSLTVTAIAGERALLTFWRVSSAPMDAAERKARIEAVQAGTPRAPRSRVEEHCGLLVSGVDDLDILLLRQTWDKVCLDPVTIDTKQPIVMVGHATLPARKFRVPRVGECVFSR